MNQNSSASRWDFGRFFKTLAYFRAIPILSSIDWFQSILGSHPDLKLDRTAIALGQSSNAATPNTILVVGATGGVGRRVVKRLAERGELVRSLVRDADRARTILGDRVELVEADLTVPETLTSQITTDIKAVICCSGTRVQPVEGDTPNREKYYQGVKFYLPEAVDSPELVEYRGMQNLIETISSPLQAAYEPLIFDFTQPSSELQNIWGAVDDVVMGGVSQSGIHLSNGAAYFAGNVSTANSGGFASIRTRNFDPPLDLSGYDGIALRIRGDGKRYKFMLRSEAKWDGIAYCHSFDTVTDRWIDLHIPFTDLIPVFRAKTLNDAEPFDASDVRAFQLMLSKFEYDGQLNPTFEPGAFQLQIESIKAYREQPCPRFVLISSAGVTRPGRSDLNLEEEPPAVRMNDQLGGILTWKLKGEAVVRDSGIPYTIIRPCALTEADGGQPLIVAQGDRLKGQVSRDDIAELAIHALQHAQARNLTFEVASGQSQCSSGDWTCLFSQLQPDSES